MPASIKTVARATTNPVRIAPALRMTAGHRRATVPRHVEGCMCVCGRCHTGMTSSLNQFWIFDSRLNYAALFFFTVSTGQRPRDKIPYAPPWARSGVFRCTIATRLTRRCLMQQHSRRSGRTLSPPCAPRQRVRGSIDKKTPRTLVPRRQHHNNNRNKILSTAVPVVLFARHQQTYLRGAVN